MHAHHKAPATVPWLYVFIIFFILLILSLSAFLTQTAFAPRDDTSFLNMPLPDPLEYTIDQSSASTRYTPPTPKEYLEDTSVPPEEENTKYSNSPE